MAAKTNHVIISYFPGADKADRAANLLMAWDQADDAIKLGGIGILTWEDGKIKTRKFGSSAGKGAKWGLALGAVTGILSGGVTLVGGAVAGTAIGAAGGKLFHKQLGLSDADKARLEQRLSNGETALVVMASEGDVAATQAELTSLGGQVDDYQVPEQTMAQIEEATDVKQA